MIIKNYVWISPNNQHLQIQIQKHINTIKNDTYDVIQFDCKESSFSDVYESMITPSLFFDGKIIILFHLEGILEEDHHRHQFIQVLQRNAEDLILCIQLDTPVDHPELKKAFNLYVDIQKSIQMNPQDMSSYIQSNLLEDGFSMDFSSQQFFLDRLKNQEESMYSYLTILKTYKMQQKVILKEDILMMVPAPIEDNIFNIVTSYIQGDIKQSLSLFEDLLVSQEDPLSILSMISRKLIEIEDVKRYLKVGLDQRQISEKMNVSNGKAYYLIKESKSLESKDIEKAIDALNILDFKIKSGQIDKTLGVYLFLIGGQNEASDDRHY
jgi:DNA polymerase-3 subunit delta